MVPVYKVGDIVSVNDPDWYLHGTLGRVVKVNRVTIVAALGGDLTNKVKGHPLFFTPATRNALV